MNDKHMNSEGTNPEDNSGNDISNNALPERELYFSGDDLNDSREAPSYSSSPQNVSNLEKIIPEDNLFESHEKITTEGENSGMNPAFSS